MVIDEIDRAVAGESMVPTNGWVWIVRVVLETGVVSWTPDDGGSRSSDLVSELLSFFSPPT